MYIYRQSKLFLVLIGVVLATVQTSFLPTLVSPGLSLNLVGALWLAIMYAKRFESAYVFAFVNGLFLDFISGNIIGITPLIMTAVILLYKMVHSFYITGAKSRFLFSCAVFIVFKIIYAQTLVVDFEVIVVSCVSALLTFLFLAYIKTK